MVLFYAVEAYKIYGNDRPSLLINKCHATIYIFTHKMKDSNDGLSFLINKHDTVIFVYIN